MTCLAYLLVFVAHITSPHECSVALDQIVWTCRLKIYQSVPLPDLQSIISRPEIGWNQMYQLLIWTCIWPWLLLDYKNSSGIVWLIKKVIQRLHRKLYYLKLQLHLTQYISTIKIFMLTSPRRLRWSSKWQNCLFLFPLTISNTKTPKLKTSDLIENCPYPTYSGDIYPLQNITAQWKKFKNI